MHFGSYKTGWSKSLHQEIFKWKFSQMNTACKSKWWVRRYIRISVSSSSTTLARAHLLCKLSSSLNTHSKVKWNSFHFLCPFHWLLYLICALSHLILFACPVFRCTNAIKFIHKIFSLRHKCIGKLVLSEKGQSISSSLSHSNQADADGDNSNKQQLSVWPLGKCCSHLRVDNWHAGTIRGA